jgi:hypothetical protein
MCWSISGCGNNIKKDLELHKKTPNNSKLIFMDNLQDESWRTAKNTPTHKHAKRFIFGKLFMCLPIFFFRNTCIRKIR